MGRTASFTLTFNDQFDERIHSTVDLLLVDNVTKVFDYQLYFVAYKNGSVIVIEELLFDITNGNAITDVGMSEAQNVVTYYETPTITQVVFF